MKFFSSKITHKQMKKILWEILIIYRQISV